MHVKKAGVTFHYHSTFYEVAQRVDQSASTGVLTNDTMNTKKQTILAKPDHTKNPHIHTSISGT